MHTIGQGVPSWLSWPCHAAFQLPTLAIPHLQMFHQAAFCLEELVLHQPADPARHLLYADTLYTIGGANNWRTARTYYSGADAAKGAGPRKRGAGSACHRDAGQCSAGLGAAFALLWSLLKAASSDQQAHRPCLRAGVIEMTKGRSIRALYGVCACAAQLAGLRRGGGGGGGDDDGGDVAQLAAEMLQQQYALHCPAKLPLVRSMLRAQGLV